MRSWMMGRLAGALLALLMVAVTTSTAFADPRDFVLVNDTSSIITHVFVSPSDVTDWGDDILGRDILEAGDSVGDHQLVAPWGLRHCPPVLGLLAGDKGNIIVGGL